MKRCGQRCLLPVQHRIRADALTGLRQTRGVRGGVDEYGGNSREVREGEVNEPLAGVQQRCEGGVRATSRYSPLHPPPYLRLWLQPSSVHPPGVNLGQGAPPPT